MKTKASPRMLFSQVLLIFILSRLTLELVGVLSLFYFPSARSIFPVTDLKYHRLQPAFLEIWARWDSEWYLMISEQGYDSYDHYREFGKGKYLIQDTAKFFPLYPIGIRIFSYLTRNAVLSGVLLSNLASLIFLYYFYLLSSKLFDSESARQGAFFYILFPTSFFLSAVYAESLFLAAVVAAFYYLEEKRLVPAALACALAVLSRPQAILAIPSLVWLAFSRIPERRLKAVLVVILASILPLAAYLFFIGQTFGSFEWVSESQRYWRGEMRYPLYALTRFAGSEIALHGQHNSILDFTFALLNLTAIVFSLRRFPPQYSLYSLVVVLVPLSSTLFSFSRLCLANFPLFLFLGSHVTGRWAFVMQMAFGMLLAFFMAAFTNWYWVG